jgi:hypothetical protein
MKKAPIDTALIAFALFSFSSLDKNLPKPKLVACKVSFASSSPSLRPLRHVKQQANENSTKNANCAVNRFMFIFKPKRFAMS